MFLFFRKRARKKKGRAVGKNGGVCNPRIRELQPKKLSVHVMIPPTPVRVFSQWPLAPNVTSIRLSANDKDDNEMIPELCTISWYSS